MLYFTQMLRRSYEFRLRPNPDQEARLLSWLDGCCELYNAALQERRDAWRMNKKSISAYDQMISLPEIREARPDIKSINAAVLQDVVRRVDKAFQAFFLRVKSGDTPGYPRFKGRKHYDSFTHPQAERASWDESSIHIPSFGRVKWEMWKDMDSLGKPKTLTVKREADGWYAVLSCEVAKPEPLPEVHRMVGIDVGLTNLVTTSDGVVLGDLEPLKRAERKLRVAQRNVSRKVKGSSRRKKAVQILARRHQDLARSRKAQLDVISKKLVTDYDAIFMEDLNLHQLINLGGNNAQGRGLRRNWRHAAVGKLTHMVFYKAESAGRIHLKVDPRRTTIDCSGCDTPVPKPLSERVHMCPSCGLVLDRDWNAARNVLKRGLRLLRGGAWAPTKREVCLGFPLSECG